MKNTAYVTPYTEIVKQEDVKYQVEAVANISADFVVLSMNMDGDFYPSVVINSKSVFSGDLLENLVEASVEYIPTAVIVVSLVDNILPREPQYEFAIDLQNILTQSGVILYDFQLMNGRNYYSILKSQLIN